MTKVSQRMVEASAGWLGTRTSRRGFLARTAVVGSALVAAPLEFALRPVSAYAAVCGPDSSCSAGYSVMCCSVNNGVNQCPPGTFAGGWWKADNAGLCGGGPRYYIDCQAECTCSYGCGPFCNSGCWNHKCHCNDDPNTCDHRLVSCNVFRYGQCNQQVACSGPVVCRQISCRPPHEWLPCSSVTATDDNTTDHTAPCLPGWDAIQARYYAAFGGPASFLGATVGAAYSVPGGTGQNFLGGRMYSGRPGVWSVHGAILDHFLALGGPSFGGLALPTSDEAGTPDGRGRYNFFQGGAIYWSPATGAWSVHGAIFARWAALGFELGPNGYPRSDESGTPDGRGRYNFFQDGAIYWSPATGAWSVHGAIFAHWAAVGFERSPLGYPISNEAATPDGRGRFNNFQHGSITYVFATGATTVTYT